MSIRMTCRGMVVIAMLTTACGGQGGSPQARSGDMESEGPSAAATESAASSDAAGGGPTGQGELCAVGHEPCPLDPGQYTAAPFEPNFSFTIDEQWTNDRASADGGGISQRSGGIYWASGLSTGRIGEDETKIGASVEDFVIFLQGLEAIGMTVSDPEPVMVDGVSGQQVDVQANDARAPGLDAITADVFRLPPDETARFLVLDKDGETVVLIVDPFTSDGFDNWVKTAQPVLDSIRWEE